MTSQVAVFNMECVAIASDSVKTVTLGRQERTLASSEKVFDLGDGHLVMVLASGSTGFLSVPLSVLFCEWRSAIEGPLPALGDYPQAFLAWLAGRSDLFDAERQGEFFAWQLADYYRLVRSEIVEELEKAGLGDAGWGERDVQAIVDEVIDRLVGVIAGQDDLPGIDTAADAQFLTEHVAAIAQVHASVFEGSPRTLGGDARLLGELPQLILAKDEPWGSDTTLAFIGYGVEDVFPGHQIVVLHGLVNGQVRARWQDPLAVGPMLQSSVVPLGQDEAISTFLRAYNSEFLRIAHRRIDQAFDALRDAADLVEGGGEDEPDARLACHEALEEDFRRVSRERFLDPMFDTVASLPPIEMARMAEALVGIQALRAASSARQPGVGGPIDVAVISRATGVQWLRRKSLSLD